jgi:hypothetical protein
MMSPFLAVQYKAADEVFLKVIRLHADSAGKSLNGNKFVGIINPTIYTGNHQAHDWIGVSGVGSTYNPDRV